MSGHLVWRAVLLSLLSIHLWLARNGLAAPTSSTTTCNLDDGRQVYVRYNAVSLKREGRLTASPGHRVECP